MHHVLVGLYSFPIWHNPCSTSHHSLDLSHSAMWLMYHLQDFGPQRVHENVSILVQLMHVYMLCKWTCTILENNTCIHTHTHTYTHNTIHVVLHSLIMMVHTLEFKRKVCPSETELVLCMHTPFYFHGTTQQATDSTCILNSIPNKLLLANASCVNLPQALTYNNHPIGQAGT